MRNIITSIALLVFIGCGEAEANSESKIVNKVIKSEDKVKTHPHTYADYKTYVNTKAHSNGIVELYLDDMTFDEAFSIGLIPNMLDLKPGLGSISSVSISDSLSVPAKIAAL